MCIPEFEPQGSAGTRNPTFGMPGRGAPESFFHRLAFRCLAILMSSDPTANADRRAAWSACAVPSAQRDLKLTPQVACAS